MIFIDGINEKYPTELLNKRPMIEGNIIGCYWSSPELYEEYKDITSNDFITEDGNFYFSLGKELYKQGYKVFDVVAVNTYLADKKILLNGFNNRGGYGSIKELIDIINIDNFESYYDELIKWNILLSLHDKGFNVIREIDKYIKMTAQQVYDYVDYQLNNIFVKRQIGTKIEDLIIDDDFLEQCNKGENMGVSYASACPLMSYITSGIHKKNVTIFAGFSGTGKTSYVLNSFILPLLEQGHKFCIIANEQDINEWKKLLLGTVVSTKIGYYKSTRKKIQIGSFSSEDWENYRKAQKWVEQYKGNLKFVKLYDYDINSVKKIIKKLRKEGFNYFLYDTFKASDNTVDKVHGQLVEDSKQLLQTADKEDVGIIITQQLAIHMDSTRYLTANCLSNSKQVKEVVSELFLMRKLWDDELTGEKKDVRPYRYLRGEDGKYSKSKEYLTLDRDKKYMIIFIDKTRSDESDICLLFQWDAQFNKWTELGWCTPHRI